MILDARNVSFSVGSKQILTRVDVQLHTGSVTAIIGPNGAGKSTLLSVISGQQKADTGTVLLGGQDLLAMPARQAAQRRAVMPQHTSVAFPFTVRDVVAMGRTPWGRSARDQSIIDEVLSRNELDAFAAREITTLSGGERQRVAFARVMAQATPIENQVILLDEPTAAMDIAHAEHTLGLVRQLAAQGAAVGMVLHDLDAAAAYADDLLLLNQGTVHSYGSVEHVCDAGELSTVYGTPIEVFHSRGRLRVSPSRAAV